MARRTIQDGVSFGQNRTALNANFIELYDDVATAKQSHEELSSKLENIEFLTNAEILEIVNNL
jgi:hypothetical protein